MLKLIRAEIYRYRSIVKMELKFDPMANMITICGKNNVGKTNTLRAMNLFFHPEEYEPQTDMPVIKSAIGGSATYPKIILDFLDDQKEEIYSIERNWSKWNVGEIRLSGKKRKVEDSKWIVLEKEECNKIISKIKFFYFETANIVMPDLVNEITDNMLVNEKHRARILNSRKRLKEAYEAYVDSLQASLDDFGESVSETFSQFKKNWNVKFTTSKNVNDLRDFISEDVELTIDEHGPTPIGDSGSGLQRLANLLLQMEIALRSKRGDSIIFLIDEPDMFLHEGLQKKLKLLFEEKSKTMQIFYTSHSKIFINMLDMKHIVLLDAQIHKQYSARKKKEISVIETRNLNVEEKNGYEKICENLGIERDESILLARRNLLVEGACDKKYFSELMRYFNIPAPQMIVADGVNNIVRYLEFYDSFYKTEDLYKPEVVVVYDNDAAGREAYERGCKKDYRHISVKHYLLQNCFHDASMALSKNNTNNEVEDFVYPEVMCYLVNNILQRKGMVLVKTEELVKQLKPKAFKRSGFMSLCEYHKNNLNPDTGTEISFISSGKTTKQVKESLAKMFTLEGDRELLKIIEEADKKYPDVRMTLDRLARMEVKGE